MTFQQSYLFTPNPHCDMVVIYYLGTIYIKFEKNYIYNNNDVNSQHKVVKCSNYQSLLLQW